MERTALVLGAGGHAAVAWEIGVLTGLADAGVDATSVKLIVGTSAGSLVGALIASGAPLEELFRDQVNPDFQTKDSAPAIDFSRWRADFMRAREEPGDSVAVLRRFGALALATPSDTALSRHDAIAARLRIHTWPERPLWITAVDCETGARRVFDRESGANIVDAVSASCAVPGIWPPVTIDGRPYMDGGVYSIDNADLGDGCDRVLIVTLPARVPPLCVQSLADAVSRLERGGAHVEIVHPDDASQAAFAFVGGNLLDPAVREPAARAGRDQGRRLRLRARHR